jgi:Xaa-Pro aminopeptidase
MFAERIDRLRMMFEQSGIDALLVSNVHNITYLSGFTSLSPEEREAFMLITKTEAFFFTDGRYLSQQLSIQHSKFKITSHLLHHAKSLTHYLTELLPPDCVVGFESDDMIFDEVEMVRKAVPGARFVPTRGLVRTMRVLKDSHEIACIKKACALTDECLTDVIPRIALGDSEKKVAFQMELWIKEHGYGLGFDPIIVAVDKNSAIAHYDTRSGSGTIKKGSVILIDVGVRYKGYVSDITRMFFMRGVSSGTIKTYEKLRAAQEKTLPYITAGKPTKEIDLFVRKELSRSNLPDYSHSTGHGIGLEIHEGPRISIRSEEVVENGQVFTIEPGVYIEGKWGMRVEDSVYITNNRAKRLTNFSKEVRIL